MLCDTPSARSFRKDHTYSSPPPTAVDSAEQGPRVLLQSELPIIHIVFFSSPPPPSPVEIIQARFCHHYHSVLLSMAHAGATWQRLEGLKKRAVCLATKTVKPAGCIVTLHSLGSAKAGAAFCLPLLEWALYTQTLVFLLISTPMCIQWSE